MNDQPWLAFRRITLPNIEPAEQLRRIDPLELALLAHLEAHDPLEEWITNRIAAGEATDTADALKQLGFNDGPTSEGNGLT